MASKAKHISQWHTFLGGGGGGSGVRDMALALLLLENLGDKFSEMSFLHCKTYFMKISRALLSLNNNLKCLIPIILLCLQCSLSKMRDS